MAHTHQLKYVQLSVAWLARFLIIVLQMIIVFSGCKSPTNTYEHNIVQHLKDEKELAKMAIATQNSEFGLDCVARLKTQELLTEVAINAYLSEVKMAAVARLTDQTALARVAVESRHRQVLEVVANHLNDQTILAEMILDYDNLKRIWMPAIERITNQTLLAKVLKETTEREVERVALSRITDQNILKDVALNYPKEQFRIAAIRRLTDQSALEELLNTTYPASIRAEAAMQVRDFKILAKVARPEEEYLKFSENESVYYVARLRLALNNRHIVSQLPGLELRGEFHTISPGPGQYWYEVPKPGHLPLAWPIGESVRLSIWRQEHEITRGEWDSKLYRKLKPGKNFTPARIDIKPLIRDILMTACLSESKLGNICITPEVYELGIVAVKLIQKQEVLEKVATSAKFAGIRAGATGRLTDQTLLTKIATDKEEVYYIRAAAVSGLNNRKLLRTFLSGLENSTIRESAEKRLAILKQKGLE